MTECVSEWVSEIMCDDEWVWMRDVRRSASLCYQICRLDVGNSPKLMVRVGNGHYKETATDHQQPQRSDVLRLVLGVASRVWRERPTATCRGTWYGWEGGDVRGAG